MPTTIAAPLDAITHIDCQDFGEIGMRAGDLDGDGRAEFVIAQGADAPQKRASTGGYPHEKTIHCLTAIDQDGKILWQHGKPMGVDERKYHGPPPLLVHDLDGDGKAEVVVMTVVDNIPMIRLYDGATGELRAERETGATYNILPANLRGLGKRDMIVGTGLSVVFAYDENLEPIWEWTSIYGGGHEHAAVDVDGSGKDDLFIGVCRVDAEANRIWWRPDLDDALEAMGRWPHIDHIHVDQLDPASGKYQVFWMGGHDLVCLDALTGETVWRLKGKHLQEGAIGLFDPDRTDKQVYVTEKGDGDIDYLLDSAGKILWKKAIGRVETVHDAAGPGHDLLLNWSPGNGEAPRLIDHRGESPLSFAFPDFVPSGRVGTTQRRSDRGFGVKPLVCDLNGDGREDIVLYNRRHICAYRLP